MLEKENWMQSEIAYSAFIGASPFLTPLLS
jgi:hypothetical protein